MNPIANIVCEYNIYQNASELEDVKNSNQDPLDGLGVCNEGKFQKLDRVVFADPIKFTDNDLNSENDAKSDQIFTFLDKVTVEKRLGKRNKYHIELADTTNPACPEVKCNKKFSTMTLLKAHIRKVHCAAQSYMCELCGASFKAQYLLTRHITAHQRQKVECPVCKRLLSKRTSLSVHMRFVHRKGDLKCDKCDQRRVNFVEQCSLRLFTVRTSRMGLRKKVCEAKSIRSPQDITQDLIVAAKGKEVQKRWRSIRDSYTKAFRQGKCPPPELCAPGSKRYQYHRQMSFLLRALQNKKPRYSQDKYESFSEISNSPQHPPPDDIPRIKHEMFDKPLDLKTKPEPERRGTEDKCSQASLADKKLEIKIDANTILPDDHFDDDKLFMNSLLPLFKKMDDDTRLLCRIEVLKIIRYALQGHKCFEALKMAEDRFFKSRMSGILAKEEVTCPGSTARAETKLSMTTRSADGSRPIRKRRNRSPSPLPMPPKRRGPGRPRKVRPPPSDSDEEQLSKKRFPRLKVPPVDVTLASEEDSFNKATSVAQLSTPLFMKMYNLERTKLAPVTSSPQSMQISIKTEPLDSSPQPALSPV